MSNQTPCMFCGSPTPNYEACDPCCTKLEHVRFDRATLTPICDWCSQPIWPDEHVVLVGESAFHRDCEREFGIFVDGAETFRMEIVIAAIG